jgi:membrane protein
LRLRLPRRLRRHGRRGCAAKKLHIMRLKNIFNLFKKAATAWVDDFAPSMGAAISYYTVFSLAPLLVIVIAIAGAVFGREAVEGQIVSQISGLIGKDGAVLVQGLVASASDTDRGLVAGLISVVILLVGATTVFAELQSALDRIWHTPEAEKPSGVVAIFKARVLSMGLILGLAFLLMVSLSVSAGLAALGAWFGGLLPGWEILLYLLNTLISVSIATVLFGMIFKLMPTASVAWRDVWVGAAVTAVLFEIGKLGIGLYIGKSGMNESFAAAGSLVILLVWVYYAAQIFLLGAEFTKVHADHHGSRSASKAVAATEATAEAGQPVEAPGARLEPALQTETQHAVQARTAAAQSLLVKEVVTLLAVSLVGLVVAKQRKKLEVRIKASPQRLRRR